MSTTEITTTTEEPTMTASAAPLTTPTSTYTVLPAPTHYAEIEAMDRAMLEAYGMRRAIGGYRRKGDDELRRLVALAYGVPVPAPKPAVEVVEEPLQVEIDETADDEEIEIPDTRTAYGDGEVEDGDDGDEPVEAIETTPEKPRKAPRKSRRLSPEVKAANALARAEKREQARLEREARKAEKRQQREALAATRKAERERRAAEKAKAKNDNAIATLDGLVIAPTDDYKDRARGVMRGAHAIARLTVDAGSTLPYRKEMGKAMRELWAILKALKTIHGTDYLDDLIGPQTAPETPSAPEPEMTPEEPVEETPAVDEIDRITETVAATVPDDDDDLEGEDLDTLIYSQPMRAAM